MSGQSLRDVLAEAAPDAEIYEDLGEGYPQALILHPSKGVIAIAECPASEDEEQVRKSLRSRFRAFLEDYVSGKELPRAELVAVQPFSLQDVRRKLEAIPDESVDSGIMTKFVDEFRPVMSFQAVLHKLNPDDGRVEREQVRFSLDRNQEQIAKQPPGDVTVLTGPAGSGKSLVLVARARLLARDHPDWNIQVVCFNRGLVPYLSSHLNTLPNVKVGTFSSWAWENGYRLNLNNCVSSWIGFEKAQRSGIYQKIDVLLVDEYQDFCSAWIALLLKSLIPGRGGAILAGDDQQRLYRDADLDEALQEWNVGHHELQIPYRSTRQILEIVSILDPEQAIPGIEHAFDGPPAEIVWTEAPLQEKANAIAHLCSLLLSNGVLVGDIAVLVTTKYMIGTITAILNDSGIKAEAKYANKIEPDDAMWSNSVKVMTVHSAKGLEFQAVFLVGIDELKSPDQAKDAEERAGFVRRARLNLVGPTRAKDSLFVIAAKENSYIRRVKDRASDLVMHHWPEDYG